MTANGKKRGRPFGIAAHNRGKKMKEPHEYAAYKKAQAKAEKLAQLGLKPEETRKADYASRSGSGHWTHREPGVDPATGLPLPRGRPAGGSGPSHWSKVQKTGPNGEAIERGKGFGASGSAHWTKAPPKLGPDGKEIPRGKPAGGSGASHWSRAEAHVAKKAAASAEGRRPLHWTQQPVEGGGTRGTGANHWKKRPPKLDANGAEIPRKQTGRKPKGDKKGDAPQS